MVFTPAYANKRIRMMREKADRLYQEERQRSTYTEIEGTDPIIPDYDFRNTRDKIDWLNENIARLKHAVNVFNTTTEIEDGSGKTIDMALVIMAELTTKKARLEHMISVEPKCLKTSSVIKNRTMVEYEVANFDLAEAQEEYRKVTEQLTALQLNLDLINNTKSLDFETDDYSEDWMQW